MAVEDPILSDGEPCRVRRLGIFDLDGVGPEVAGPYTYTWKMANGEVVESAYDISKITVPPAHPGVPEDQIQSNTPQYFALLEHQTYKAALIHERVRVESIVDYVKDVSRFIMERCLVDPADRSRIVTQEDWMLIYHAVVIPQITIEHVAEVFQRTFKARFEGMDVFQALQRVAGGHGSYDALRLWEFQAMERYGYQTEDTWADLPLSERARKMASIALPKLMESLETDAHIKEMKTNG